MSRKQGFQPPPAGCAGLNEYDHDTEYRDRCRFTHKARPHPRRTSKRSIERKYYIYIYIYIYTSTYIVWLWCPFFGDRDYSVLLNKK